MLSVFDYADLINPGERVSYDLYNRKSVNVVSLTIYSIVTYLCVYEILARPEHQYHFILLS